MIFLTLSVGTALSQSIDEGGPLFASRLPDLTHLERRFVPTLRGSSYGGSAVDDMVQLLAMLQRSASNHSAPILESVESAMKRCWSARLRLRTKFRSLSRRYLGWTNGGDAYSLSRSQFAEDAESEWTWKRAYFWFITVFSNSFAVGFGLKAAVQGVHPKFHFSTKMSRSMVFHIVVGSVEFVWVVIMYLSVPQWWHSAVLVVLDSIQNVTIWIQFGSSQGVKMVTNSCYLFCLAVKAICCGLLIVDPFSRDLVWAIYEILSAFTLTRISGMSFKKLALFQGQMYTLAVFTATMISSAQAFGSGGPCALYLFMIAYSAAHSQPATKRRKGRKSRSKRADQTSAATATTDSPQHSVSWTVEAMRNPFRDEESMRLVRSLLKEGDQQRASKEERARTVFQIMTGGDGKIQWLSYQQLAAVMCPSGVAMTEVDNSFAELSTVNPLDGQRAIHFDTFFSKLPTVWDWYFDYLYESVFHPERQIR